MVKVKNPSAAEGEDPELAACGQIDENGKPDGIVRIVTQSYIYEGQWKEGKPNGWGRFIDHKGEYYIGWFARGSWSPHGYGKWLYADGTVKEGLWDNYTFVGEEQAPSDLNEVTTAAFEETDYIVESEAYVSRLRKGRSSYC